MSKADAANVVLVHGEFAETEIVIAPHGCRGEVAPHTARGLFCGDQKRRLSIRGFDTGIGG